MKNSVVAIRVSAKHNFVENVFTTKNSLEKYLEYMNRFSDESIKLINCHDEEITIKQLFTSNSSRDNYAYFWIVEKDNKSLYNLTQKPLNRGW